MILFVLYWPPMKTSYKKTFPEQAYNFCTASGKATDRAIASVLGVSRESVRKWRTYGTKDFRPDFAAAIKKGQADIDCGKIKNAMIKRACGYKTKKTIEGQVIDKDGEVVDVEKKEIWTVAPDVAAAKYVLANHGREEGRWLDPKNKIEHSGSVGLDLSDVLKEIDGDGANPGI